MAHRVISDRSGQTWDVWEVQPRVIDAAGSAPIESGEQPPDENRHLKHVVPRLRNGWLAFQSRSEKRRLAPVPTRWEELDDAGLLALLDSAKSVGETKRLIE